MQTDCEMVGTTFTASGRSARTELGSASSAACMSVPAVKEGRATESHDEEHFKKSSPVITPFGGSHLPDPTPPSTTCTLQPATTASTAHKNAERTHMGRLIPSRARHAWAIARRSISRGSTRCNRYSGPASYRRVRDRPSMATSSTRVVCGVLAPKNAGIDKLDEVMA